jgi:hypothetical protein
MSVTRYDLVGEYDAVMGRIPDGDYVLYEDYARLRAAVAALMATKRAWWYDSEYSQCMYCDSSTYHTSETVTHAPDCPAMALEAAMKEGDDA